MTVKLFTNMKDKIKVEDSGGPLFDLTKGQVIGINTFTSSRTLSLIHVQNFALAIWPILTRIRSELNQIQNEKDMSENSLKQKVSSYLQQDRIEDAYHSHVTYPGKGIIDPQFPRLII